MKKFEILEHTADLKIRVFGRTKEELFLNAMLGMMDALRAEVKISPGSTWAACTKLNQKVKVRSVDLETLLVDFLSEVLYLSQVNKEVYSNVAFPQFADDALEAELTGQRVERFGEDIKAVTYHNLDIRQRENSTWEATILFDI